MARPRGRMRGACRCDAGGVQGATHPRREAHPDDRRPTNRGGVRERAAEERGHLRPAGGGPAAPPPDGREGRPGVWPGVRLWWWGDTAALSTCRVVARCGSGRPAASRPHRGRHPRLRPLRTMQGGEAAEQRGRARGGAASADCIFGCGPPFVRWVAFFRSIRSRRRACMPFPGPAAQSPPIQCYTLTAILPIHR